MHDPISARITEEIGFEAGMLAGSKASLAVLGAPDLILLTLTEFADLARRICRASGLPVIADADHGYGNAPDAMRTVEELAHAGVAALSIEDTELPKPFGTTAPRLVSLEESVGKIRTALVARSDASLVVMARTGAVSVTGLEDALRRIRAYQACGPDAIFLTGVTTRAELDAIFAAARLPLMLETLSEEFADRRYLASRGVRISPKGHAPFLAAAEAVRATLAALRAGVRPGELLGVAKVGDARRWIREGEYAAHLDAYLRPGAA